MKPTHIKRDTLLAANSIYKELYSDPEGLLNCTVQVIWLIGWKPSPLQPKPMVIIVHMRYSYNRSNNSYTLGTRSFIHYGSELIELLIAVCIELDSNVIIIPQARGTANTSMADLEKLKQELNKSPEERQKEKEEKEKTA